MFPSVPDQHEDDACCDVQTADGTGDARLHIEDPAWISPTVALHVWLRDDNKTGGSVGRGEFIFLSFYFFLACCRDAVKNIRFSLSQVLS